MSPEAAEVKRWLEKADHDAQTGKLALAQAPPITDVGAFHAQQAVEKLLKAYLVYREHPFEKIHDLEELIDQCARHDPVFSDFRDRVAPLTAYAVRFRYPGPADPTVEQVGLALGVVDEVWDFVLGRLPAEVRP
ncbi:MAG: HEPN domain-containing protein [Phycisphaerae bacterium]